MPKRTPSALLNEWADIVREVAEGLPPDRIYDFGAPQPYMTPQEAAEEVLRSRGHGLPSVIWAYPDDVTRWRRQGFPTFWGIPIQEHPSAARAFRQQSDTDTRPVCRRGT